MYETSILIMTQSLFFLKVTYADFAVYVLLETLEADSPSLLDNFPSLNKLKNSVQKLPNIDKWLKNRPVTPY